MSKPKQIPEDYCRINTFLPFLYLVLNQLEGKFLPHKDVLNLFSVQLRKEKFSEQKEMNLVEFIFNEYTNDRLHASATEIHELK